MIATKLNEPRRVHASLRPLTDPTDPVLNLTKRSHDPEDPLGVVEADEKIQAELVKQKSGWFEQIRWKNSSFHGCNRDTTLASPLEVKTLMADVDYVGLSHKALDHALCVQKEPGNSYSEEKTREWVRKSPVLMAEVVEGTIHFHSLACSHMTQGMRSLTAPSGIRL
jgi:hypothetical protein